MRPCKLQPIDQMERIDQKTFGERLDEFLDRIDAENVGFVITKDGKDDLVICPLSWFDPIADDDFGFVINDAASAANQSDATGKLALGG